MKNNMKVALITGITGQDGSYLAEFLLNKGYFVYGIIRRSSSFNTGRIDHIYNNPNLKLHFGDVSDSLSIDSIVKLTMPDEIYHLAAQSHVKVSYEIPKYTADSIATGTLVILEAMRKHVPNARFYNAATSELYGNAQEIPQNENTQFYPRSPYGVAKLYSFWIVKNYRESYGLHASNGILFNHESERRGDTFVTKKIVNGILNYEINKEPFYLGNIYAKRDWGYAKEYVKAMWLMLQQKSPDDYVISSGETHSIKEFIEECLIYTNINYKWAKDNKNRDILWDINNDSLIIGIDEKYYRPAEVNLLLGDSSKAKRILGWEPETKFKNLVYIMMKYNNKIVNNYEKK